MTRDYFAVLVFLVSHATSQYVYPYYRLNRQSLIQPYFAPTSTRVNSKLNTFGSPVSDTFQDTTQVNAYVKANGPSFFFTTTSTTPSPLNEIVQRFQSDFTMQVNPSPKPEWPYREEFDKEDFALLEESESTPNLFYEAPPAPTKVSFDQPLSPQDAISDFQFPFLEVVADEEYDYNNDNTEAPPVVNPVFQPIPIPGGFGQFKPNHSNNDAIELSNGDDESSSSSSSSSSSEEDSSEEGSNETKSSSSGEEEFLDEEEETTEINSTTEESATFDQTEEDTTTTEENIDETTAEQDITTVNNAAEESTTSTEATAVLVEEPTKGGSLTHLPVLVDLEHLLGNKTVVAVKNGDQITHLVRLSVLPVEVIQHEANHRVSSEPTHDSDSQAYCSEGLQCIRWTKCQMFQGKFAGMCGQPFHVCCKFDQTDDPQDYLKGPPPPLETLTEKPILSIGHDVNSNLLDDPSDYLKGPPPPLELLNTDTSTVAAQNLEELPVTQGPSVSNYETPPPINAPVAQPWKRTTVYHTDLMKKFGSLINTEGLLKLKEKFNLKAPSILTATESSTTSAPSTPSALKSGFNFKLALNTYSSRCSAAMKCVKKSFCTLAGIVSDEKLAISDIQRTFSGVPLIPCNDGTSQEEDMVCCRSSSPRWF